MANRGRGCGLGLKISSGLESSGISIGGKSSLGGIGSGRSIGFGVITDGVVHLCGSSPSNATHRPCGICRMLIHRPHVRHLRL